MNGKYKLRVVILAILFLLAGWSVLVFYNYKKAHTVPEHIYVEDYPEIYSEEFRIIFGEDCEIGEKNTIYKEGYVCGCGHIEHTYQYDTWEVTYHDRRGEKFTQTIDNRYSLESLQRSWLESHLSQYYEKYLIDYFKEGTFEEWNFDEETFEELTRTMHCSVSIGFGSYSLMRTEETARIDEGNHKYQEQLLAAFRDRNTMLRLSGLNYEEIYNQYPITSDFYLSIDDRELSGEEKAVHEKAVQDRGLEMLQAIQRETDGTCNLIVRVDSANGYEDLYDGANEWLYYILQGKQIESEGESYYAIANAYAYEGVYWWAF